MKLQDVLREAANAQDTVKAAYHTLNNLRMAMDAAKADGVELPPEVIAEKIKETLSLLNTVVD